MSDSKSVYVVSDWEMGGNHTVVTSFKAAKWFCINRIVAQDKPFFIEEPTEKGKPTWVHATADGSSDPEWRIEKMKVGRVYNPYN